TNRMMLLELCDLRVAPGMDALAPALVLAHIGRRIAGNYLLVDRIVEHHAQHLEQVVGRLPRLDHGAFNLVDVTVREPFQRLVAVQGAETFDDVAVNALRCFLQPTEFRRAIIRTRPIANRTTIDVAICSSSPHNTGARLTPWRRHHRA